MGFCRSWKGKCALVSQERGHSSPEFPNWEKNANVCSFFSPSRSPSFVDDLGKTHKGEFRFVFPSRPSIRTNRDTAASISHSKLPLSPPLFLHSVMLSSHPFPLKAISRLQGKQEQTLLNDLRW